MGKPYPAPKLTERQVARFHLGYQKRAAHECWEWSPIADRGYGVFSAQGRGYRAHRLSYFLATGEDPGEQMVCHSCDNRACVNPAHLWLGDAKANTDDMMSKGRQGGGCLPSHCQKPLREVRVNTAAMRVALKLLDYVEDRAVAGCEQAQELVAYANADRAPSKYRRNTTPEQVAA